MKHMDSKQLEKRYRTDIKSAQGVAAMALVLSLVYIVRWLITKEFDFYFCTSVTEFLLKAASFSENFRGSIPAAAAIAGAAVYIGLYILGVILGQKDPKKLWFTLILYLADTVFLLAIDFSGYFAPFAKENVIDIVFHAFLLVFLIVGVSSVKKLTAMNLPLVLPKEETKD
ncbi:MAG: hypothetical protein Q4D20_04540 [Clostridia bacterium]|nr:hypothetical protein [Clostridia bacterium]